jgi:hypothetical protein
VNSLKGLIVKGQWLDLILDGKKTWEIRGSRTNVRGRIALIKSGTGLIFGTVELLGCTKLPLSQRNLDDTKLLHCIDDLSRIKDKKPYAWQMGFPIRFDKPIPYIHPKGAIIWVNLPDVA